MIAAALCVLFWLTAAAAEPDHFVAAAIGSPAPVKVADPMGYTLDQLKDSEKRFNVKCFTTFGSAEGALAQQELGPGAIERRAELLARMADVLYGRMKAMAAVTGDGALGAELVRQIFRNTLYAGSVRDSSGAKWSYTLAQGDPIVVLDGEDYIERKLSEGWRSVVALLQRQSKEELRSLPLSKESLDELHEVMSTYDLLLLRAAGRLSREHGRHQVLPADLDEADSLLHTDLTAYVAQIHTGRAHLTDEGLARYNSILFAQAKAFDVEAFNGHVDDENRRAHYEKLAEYPLTKEALKALVERALPGIGRLVWRRAQAGMPEDEIFLAAAPMAKAVDASFPSAVDDEENVEFFPKSGKPVRVYAFESDSFRDEPFFWQMLARMLREDLKARKEAGPQDLWAPLDPYAADEFTEVLSNLGVPVMKEAASRARAAGRAKIEAGDVLAAGAYFEERARAVKPEVPVKEEGATTPARKMKGPLFEDITSVSGIAASPKVVDWEKTTIIDKDFNGMAVLDYDGDGLPDVFLCGTTNRLFKNMGHFKFKDVTAEAGGFGQGCRGASSADYDNDGRPDLLILGTGQDEGGLRLYHNENGKRFLDVTEKALPKISPLRPVSAAWLDYDRDGNLDLYVVNHGLKDQGVFPTLGDSKNALPNRLLRNNGDGTFSDVTEKAGVGDTGWGMAAVAFDYDNDGWTDLYVGNDFGRSVLYKNMRDGTFKDVSQESGADSFGHAMGVSVADVAHNGYLDVFVTNIGMYNPGARYIRPTSATPIQYSPPLEKGIRIHEANRMYVNQGGGKFKEAYETLFEPAPTGWGWSGMFFDFDNDGGKDLYLVNGLNPTALFHNNGERKVLFHWDQKARRFVDVSKASGADFAGISEGCAFADLGGRGRLDLIAIGRMGVHVFKNVAPSSGHWLEVKLVGTKTNRDGFGSRVTVKAGDMTRFAEYGSEGGGFVATSQRVAHFGLGSRKKADALEIRWLDGTVQTFKDVKADRVLVIKEGQDKL